MGLPMSDPPVRAPVLLQHILRDVLSTEPKQRCPLTQRVGYFKALLSLTDLDMLQERVVSVRSVLERGIRSHPRCSGVAVPHSGLSHCSENQGTDR